MRRLFCTLVLFAASAQAQILLPQMMRNNSTAHLLFRSGFESSSAINTPTNCGSTECYQQPSGTDAASGYTWPPQLWGSQTTFLGGGWWQLQTNVSQTPTTVVDYIQNTLEPTGGRNGTQGLKMLNQTTLNGHVTGQDPFQITPDVSQPQGDFYIRVWFKLQSNILTEMCQGQNGDGTWCDWRALAEWKTGGQANGGANPCIVGQTWGGDYRNIIFVIKSAGALKWRVQADTVANGGLAYNVFWQTDNTSVPVPVDEWFKLEWFVHRATDSTGRIWVAINGTTIADFHGVTINTPAYGGGSSCKINRIMPFTVYNTAASPIYQWVDDLEIWDGFPVDASAH